MSRRRGIFPLFLATAIGIVNGVWVFGPTFKELQREKDEQTRNALENAPPSESKEIEKDGLRKSEAAASRPVVTESTLKQPTSTSWWSNMSLWSEGSGGTSSIPIEKPSNPNSKD